jgi:hypothetical protein
MLSRMDRASPTAPERTGASLAFGWVTSLCCNWGSRVLGCLGCGLVLGVLKAAQGAQGPPFRTPGRTHPLGRYCLGGWEDLIRVPPARRIRA